MKNLKQLTAIAMCSVFATMQISCAAPIDTGLGIGNGGAVINSTDSNFAGFTPGTNSATLKFNGNSHVNWNTLNLNKNETLNFNAETGKSGISVLNTVNNNMSKIYGNIKTNDGISKVIISNPNGVLFDGAKFTTAGDVMVTTKNMTNVNVNNLTDGSWTTLVDPATNDLVKVQVLNNSDFGVGGEIKIIAPRIEAFNSKITAGKGLKLTTANGADYTALGYSGLKENKGVTLLRAMNINGNVEIVNGVGALEVSNGTEINGNLKTETGSYAHLFGADENNKIHIAGDAELTGHGQHMILRNAVVDGDVKMTNDGGFVEINNLTANKNVDLKTTGWQPVNHQKYDHFVHVVGNTNIKGDLNIESSQNIHIGNYEVTQIANNSQPWGGNLLPGKLTVDGDIKAKVTDGGHIMTTIDTTAKNIDYTAKSRIENGRVYGGNILSDDKATISAETYKFKSDGYIGGLKASNGYSVDDKIINAMENYQFIPDDTSSHEYMNISGGTISMIETPKVSAEGNDVQVYIKSKGDLLVKGANAGDINLVAPNKQITITGDDVQAKEINVGGATKILQLDYPNRKFTTNYTSIKTGDVVTIKPDEEITYELANKPDVGYNSPDLKPSDDTNTTYLVGPGYNPPPPPPGPNPKPKKNPNPPDDDNVRVKNWVPEDPMKPMANTPVAYAADLDDEGDVPCRKNVDGSVTVVKAYPVMN